MSSWETNIYSQGKQLNKYPYDSVVSFIFKNYSKLSEIEKRNIRVLDLGCGSGNNSLFLSDFGFETYGIDISPSAIEFAEKESDKLRAKINFTIGNINKLSYEDNFFDLVIDRSSLTCCPEENLEETINEISRVLKVNGILKTFDFFNEFSSEDFKKDLKYTYGNINFSPNFIQLLNKNFRIDYMEQINKIYPINSNQVKISIYNIKCLNIKSIKI